MSNKKFNLKDFYFELPDELIAQYPLEERDDSRLFILDRKSGKHEHRYFREIIEYIEPGDLLVINDVRVLKARMFFFRQSGATIEVIMTQKKDEKHYLILTNRTKRLKKNETIISSKDNTIKLTVIDRVGEYLLVKANRELTESLLSRIGEIPLPPYIKRKPGKNDDERYQTVYSKNYGAVAAPTAGLHFTKALVNDIKAIGATFASVTLNVSWGTFQPVRTENISEHMMHSEDYEISNETANEINKARKEGRRIFAVGTTTLRVLESTFDKGCNNPGKGSTDIFIYPPYKIRSIDAMITNFHTPCSTLLMLVSAFAGYDTIMEAYKEAVEMKYRFFSYGDAMLIL